MNNLACSYSRTLVPIAVGWLISFALRHGFDLSGYQGLLTAVTTAVYYAAVRAAEHWVSPRFGWLLGSPAQPSYRG